MLTLAEALAALPDTADGIAAFLAERGIRGVKVRACECPLSAYLKSLGMSWTAVSVATVVAVVDGKRCHQRPRDAAVEFMRRFDAGEWPELVVADV